MNFWYAACGPCRVEAKDLQSVWQKFDGKGVSFVGVNTYDQPGTASAFNEKYGVTYPSIIDVNTGDAKLAFAEVTSIQATPDHPRPRQAGPRRGARDRPDRIRFHPGDPRPGRAGREVSTQS